MTKHLDNRLGRNLRHPAGGGAAVEFALVLPIFMLLVMGALDYGYFFFSDQVVSGAAREGARAGTMVNPANGNTAATDAAKAAAYQYMTNNGISCYPLSGDTCITATIQTVSAATLSMQAVDVVIDHEFRSLTGYSSLVIPKRIYGHSVMRWQ